MKSTGVAIAIQLTLLAAPATLAQHDSQPLGLSVFEFINQEDYSFIESNGDTLGTEIVQLDGKADVATLLESRSILVNGESLSAILALNPELRGFVATEGMVLVVPKVEVPIGYKAKLVMYSGRKDALRREVDDLVRASAQIDDPTLSEVVDYLTTFIGVIDAESKIITNQQLGVYEAYVRTANQLIECVDCDQAKLRDFLSNAAEDLSVRAAAMTETLNSSAVSRFPFITINVSTASASGQSSGYRVKAVPIGLVNDHNSTINFPQLSSPTSHKLSEGRYILWGTKPAGGGELLTESLVLTVTKEVASDENRLDVTLSSPND